MARIARVTVPGVPHHITQRGNRRQQTFFNDDDYESYLILMEEWCNHCGADYSVSKSFDAKKASIFCLIAIIFILFFAWKISISFRM